MTLRTKEVIKQIVKEKPLKWKLSWYWLRLKHFMPHTYEKFIISEWVRLNKKDE